MKMLVWFGGVAVAIVFTLALFVGETRATPVEQKTEIRQTETQQTQQQPSPQTKTINQNRVVPQNPTREMQSAINSLAEQVRNFQDLQKRVDTLENTLASTGKDNQSDPRMAHWLSAWWQVGFWTGALWMFLWVFVGTQWSRRKFWGFGWPWPWWFWIPIFWFLPWLFLAWQWWLDWWDWWVWIWWLFPWVFWVFWWIVLFKEATIWVWKRR